MTETTLVDPVALREDVKEKYSEVARNPHGSFHFHTGRRLAKRLGYDTSVVGQLPDIAVESFAGVANPFSMAELESGARVVDAGSGGGFDSFIAAGKVGPTGRVVGIDMTEEMLSKSRTAADRMGLAHVQMSSSATAFSIFVQTSPAYSKKFTACSSQADGYSLLTSPTGHPYLNRRPLTSISGLRESQVVCRAQNGKRCWNTAVLSM